MSSKNTKIQSFILSKVRQHPADIASLTMKKFQVTRTTVHRHIQQLIKSGRLFKAGITSQVRYYLSDALDFSITLSLDQQQDEFLIWQEYFEQTVARLAKQNVLDIVEYGLTEMINNAIDHSQGGQLMIQFKFEKNNLMLILHDDGLGAYRTLNLVLRLDGIRDVILDLSKGKLTRDPANHTGEGVFFSSRVFDYFEVKANGFKYIRDNNINDWFVCRDNENTNGTVIVMKIDIKSDRDLVKTFKAYQDEETLSFDRTSIKVDLAETGRKSLISRSEAKRIVRNISQEYNHVLLDFAKIDLIGQGFADEIFRVYQQKRPELSIEYCNANEDIEFMIKRAV